MLISYRWLERHVDLSGITPEQLALDLRRSRPWLGAIFSTGDIVQEVFLGVLRVRPTGEGVLLVSGRRTLAEPIAVGLRGTEQLLALPVETDGGLLGGIGPTRPDAIVRAGLAGNFAGHQDPQLFRHVARRRKSFADILRHRLGNVRIGWQLDELRPIGSRQPRVTERTGERLGIPPDGPLVWDAMKAELGGVGAATFNDLDHGTVGTVGDHLAFAGLQFGTQGTDQAIPAIKVCRTVPESIDGREPRTAEEHD